MVEDGHTQKERKKMSLNSRFRKCDSPRRVEGGGTNGVWTNLSAPRTSFEMSSRILVHFFHSILFLKYLKTLSYIIFLGSGLRQGSEDTEARTAHPKRGASPPSPACRIKRTALCDSTGDSQSFKMRNKLYGDICDRFTNKNESFKTFLLESNTTEQTWIQKL